MAARKNQGKKAAARKQSLRSPLGILRKMFFLGVPLILLFAAGYFLFSGMSSVFTVNKVVFTGNTHLADEELRALAGLKGKESLAALSSRDIFRRLSGSPWIKSVSVRKEFPDRLHILIKEAEPFALLDMKGRLFIVDETGKMLEELKESSMPFLPIVIGNPYGEKEVFSEAMRLVHAVKETGLMARKNHIEVIAHKLQEITANLDGVVVKVGAGDYEEKLARLSELEGEIRNRRIPVDYIDLRFANKVVVKPVTEVIR